jgi:hypothetical protein
VLRPRILIATATAAFVVALAPLQAGSARALGVGPVHATAARGQLPAGFRAQSQDWISPNQGFVLGTKPCTSSVCTTVIGTTDGSATWKSLGTINAPLTLETKKGVTEIRFADDLHGWAFDPAAWATTDGGATWKKLTPPGGRPLIALAGDADAVYAVISACGFGVPISNCTHQTTLWRTTPSQGSWTQADLALPVTNQAIMAVHGVVAYLVVPASLIDRAGSTPAEALDVTVDVQTWSPRPDPCMPAEGETLSGIAPISDTEVALLCQGNIGFGKAEKRVLRSKDTGQTTSSAGTMPIYGIVTQLAATPDGTLVASSFSIGSWIYRNAGGGIWTTQEDLGDGGIGWNDVAFTTNQVGFVVHGPASCCGGQGPGELWETQDGGVTWSPS